MLVEVIISCPRGQARGELNESPLSLLEESYGGLWCGVGRRLAEGRCWSRRESSGFWLSRCLIAGRRVVADALSFWKRMWKLRVESSVIPR